MTSIPPRDPCSPKGQLGRTSAPRTSRLVGNPAFHLAKEEHPPRGSPCPGEPNASGSIPLRNSVVKRPGFSESRVRDPSPEGRATALILQRAGASRLRGTPPLRNPISPRTTPLPGDVTPSPRPFFATLRASLARRGASSFLKRPGLQRAGPCLPWPSIGPALASAASRLVRSCSSLLPLRDFRFRF